MRFWRCPLSVSEKGSDTVSRLVHLSCSQEAHHPDPRHPPKKPDCQSVFFPKPRQPDHLVETRSFPSLPRDRYGFFKLTNILSFLTHGCQRNACRLQGDFVLSSTFKVQEGKCGQDLLIQATTTSVEWAKGRCASHSFSAVATEGLCF